MLPLLMEISTCLAIETTFLLNNKFLFVASLFHSTANNSSIYCPLSNCWPMAFSLVWQVILSSKGVAQILGLLNIYLHFFSQTSNGYRVDRALRILKKMKVYNKSVLDWFFSDNSTFGLTRTDLFVFSMQLRATDPPSGQPNYCSIETQPITELLTSE